MFILLRKLQWVCFDLRHNKKIKILQAEVSHFGTVLFKYSSAMQFKHLEYI